MELSEMGSSHLLQSPEVRRGTGTSLAARPTWLPCFGLFPKRGRADAVPVTIWRLYHAGIACSCFGVCTSASTQEQ